MEDNSKKMGDGLVWFLLALVVVGMSVMVWMGTKNQVQAPSTSTNSMLTPTPMTTETVTPTPMTTPASNATIDQKLKEVNSGGQAVDASFSDTPINVQ